MESLLVVMEIVALAAAAALCVYLIIVLVRVRDLLALISRELREIGARAIPVMENLEVITDRVKGITENLDEQVDIVKGAVSAFRGVADSIVEFERRIQERIEEPVLESVGTLAALFKGVRTFVARLRA